MEELKSIEKISRQNKFKMQMAAKTGKRDPPLAEGEVTLMEAN